MDDRPDDPASSTADAAEAAFLEFVDRRERGEALDFDEFCAARPALAPVLRSLHANWSWMEDAGSRLRAGDDRGVSEALDARLSALGRRRSDASGRYTVLEAIGRGGMGAVFKVLDNDIRRTLAMKVSHASRSGDDGRFRSAADATTAARFLEEAQITGQLQHPGVVPIHELGVDGDGRIFFTMRLVEGSDLGAVFESARQGRGGWTIPRAVGVLVRVCETIAYAHSKGVVHRDLKPANVMVGRFGETYVVDWGLARVNRSPARRVEATGPLLARSADSVRTDRQEEIERDPESPLLTSRGLVVGTPAYLAPEQAEGRGGDAGPRTDIYALGAMLYTLLTGRRPYAAPGPQSASSDMISAIREGPPVRVRRLNPAAPAELEAICEKAMARSPGDRYGSASTLAEELQAYLEGRVVRAHRTGARAELWKWVLRNKLSALFLAAFALLAFAGFAILNVVQSRANSRLRAQKAETALESYVASIGAASAALRVHDVAEARLRLDRAPDALRGWEWRHLRAGLDQSLFSLPGHSQWVRSVAYSPDGSRIVTASSDGTARLFDGRSGEPLRVLRGHDGDVNAAVFTPDGRRVLTGSADGTARLFDVESGECVAVPWRDASAVSDVAIDPSGVLFAVASEDGCVRLLRLDGPGEPVLLDRNALGPLCVTFSPDGRSVASGGHDRTVRLFDVESGALAWAASDHEKKVGSLAFSPDGRILVTCDGALTFRDVESGRAIDRWARSELGDLGKPAFLPGGERLAAYGWEDRTIRVFDVATREILSTLHGHEEPVVGLAVSPDGSRIASACHDGSVKLWDPLFDGDVRVLRGHENYCLSIAFDGSGERIASAGKDYAVRVWDTGTGESVATHFVSTDVFGMEFAPRGDALALAMRDHAVRVIDATTGEERVVMRGHEGHVVAVAYSPGDGAVLASASLDGTARLWDAANGRETAVLRGHSAAVRSVAFSPDGSRLASGSDDATIRIHDAAAPGHDVALLGHAGGVEAVAFHPNGALLASASADRTVRIWDVATGRNLAILRGHARAVTTLAFSPDGSRLASGSQDRYVLVWETATWREVARLRGHEWWIHSVRFSPDGKTVASGSRDGTVRLFGTEALGAVAPASREAFALRESVRPRVEALFGELAFTTAVVERLSIAGPGLSADVRKAAVRLARAIGDDPRRLDGTTWRALCAGEVPPSEAAALLRRARAARDLDTENPAVAFTLVAALYRAGEFEEAVATRIPPDSRGLAGVERAAVGAAAFRALALHALGRSAEARELLRPDAPIPDSDVDAATSAILDEARRVVLPRR